MAEWIRTPALSGGAFIKGIEMLEHKDSHQHSNQHNDRKDEHTYDAHGHGHTHGAIDPSVLTTERGIWAVKWSFIGLFATAIFQIVIALLSGSVALLADTIHNIGDAATAIPLWIAFKLARWKPNKRFTYGYGRVEDLAGIVIVLTILASAALAAYESIARILHPQNVEHLWTVVVASVVGFIGNEAVAIFRIRVGKEIGSAALIADGYHARVDGFTSLAVLFGAVGVWLGYPLADPIVGLLITVAILRIVWDSAKSVFTRLLDGVDPQIIDEINHSARHDSRVEDITNVRVRWLGHRLHAELNIAVNPTLSIEQGHEIAMNVRHELLHHLRYLSGVTIHIDPINASGDEHHHILEHTHDDLPAHPH
jgi:cation diffusion facilitator family transporter